MATRLPPQGNFKKAHPKDIHCENAVIKYSTNEKAWVLGQKKIGFNHYKTDFSYSERRARKICIKMSQLIDQCIDHKLNTDKTIP